MSIPKRDATHNIGEKADDVPSVNHLVDGCGRRIDYLRVSVTDRCNLRCIYCMPVTGVRWNRPRDLLSLDEFVRVIECAAALGVRKIRLTGGEPLVRPDLVELVRAISNIRGIAEMTVTTNGMLLENLAAPLADAGLSRVNVSLDTLNADTFRHITRFGDLRRVWRGIEAAERAGLTPIKLNTVVIRGVNDMELPELARLTLTRAWQVRFIEVMPVGNTGDWGDNFPLQGERYVSTREMMHRLGPLGLVRAEGTKGSGPARMYRLPGAAGSIGFISPISDHFCATCNRLRLTADGRLRPCLLSSHEILIREALRKGADVTPLIEEAVSRKPQGHTLSQPDAQERQNRMMSQIGG